MESRKLHNYEHDDGVHYYNEYDNHYDGIISMRKNNAVNKCSMSTWIDDKENHNSSNENNRCTSFSNNESSIIFPSARHERSRIVSAAEITAASSADTDTDSNTASDTSSTFTNDESLIISKSKIIRSLMISSSSPQNVNLELQWKDKKKKNFMNECDSESNSNDHYHYSVQTNNEIYQNIDTPCCSQKEQSTKQQPLTYPPSPTSPLYLSSLNSVFGKNVPPSHILPNTQNQSPLSVTSSTQSHELLPFQHDIQQVLPKKDSNPGWLDRIKSILFSSDTGSRNCRTKNILIVSSPTTTTTSTEKPMISNFCCAKHHIESSPQTPEYEERCKEELLRRTRETQPVAFNSHGHNENTPLSAQKKTSKNVYHSNNHYQSTMKTVKKANTTLKSLVKSTIESQIQTVKKKNINSATNDLLQEQQECYFRGYDGQRSHYTYVSPMKDEHGFPVIKLDNKNDDDDILVGKNIDFTAVAMMKDTSPDEFIIANDKSVIHVVSPKKTKVCKREEGERCYECKIIDVKNKGSMNTSTSKESLSSSMISEERRIVNDYLRNTENSNVWMGESKRINYNVQSSNMHYKYQNHDYVINDCSDHENNQKVVISLPPSPTIQPTIQPTIDHILVNNHLTNYNDDQTIHTIGTNGTMHRRNDNSTNSFFTDESLAQIFDNHDRYNADIRQQHQSEQLCGLSLSNYHEVPLSIQNICRTKGDEDEESLVSPLGDNEGEDNERIFQFNEETILGQQNYDKSKPRKDWRKINYCHKSKSSLLDDWSDVTKVIVAKKLVLPPEPNGTYMPKSTVFKEDLTEEDKKHITLEGWVAFSKGSRLLKSLTIQDDKDTINRKDLRYIIITKNQMFVFTSKKNDEEINAYSSTSTLLTSASNFTKYNNATHRSHNNDINDKTVKILHLRKGMKVEVQHVSKRHGHSVCIIDTIHNKTNAAKNQEMHDCHQKVICSLLPVRLDSQYFLDKEYSQIIRSKKFKNISHTLFGTNRLQVTTKLTQGMKNGNYTNDILHDKCNENNHDAYFENSNCYIEEEEEEYDHKKDGNERESCLSSNWPSCMPQIAPEQQNTTALCLQFALDAACHLQLSNSIPN